MDIRFGDHPSFHRAAAGMVGASAALGVALHAVTPLAPLIGGLLGIAVGAAWGYGKPAFRIAAAAIASAIILVMAPKGLMSTTAPSAPMLAAAAGVLALGIAAYGLRGIKGAFAVMLGAAVTLLAMWAAVRIDVARQTHAWPSLARDGVSAAAMGMIGVLATLPRHLRVSLDPVAAAIRRLPVELDGEVRELCNRSIAIWAGAKDKLADSDPGKNLVRDGVLKALEVATKSADVKISGASEAELGKRMADLDGRIANATDGEVKAQYQAARAALDDQKRYRDHIHQNRERLIARMHNHVAALEKFQLAAGGLVAARAASAGASAVKQLEELSADVAASGEARAELEIGAVPEAKPAEVGTAEVGTAEIARA